MFVALPFRLVAKKAAFSGHVHPFSSAVISTCARYASHVDVPSYPGAHCRTMLFHTFTGSASGVDPRPHPPSRWTLNIQTRHAQDDPVAPRLQTSMRKSDRAMPKSDRAMPKSPLPQSSARSATSVTMLLKDRRVACNCIIIAISCALLASSPSPPCCLGVVGSSAMLPVRFVTDLVAYISKPHSQTPCVTRRLDGPRAVGFDR